MQRKYTIILVLSSILMFFWAGGFLMPEKSVVKNEIIITQKPEVIYPYLSQLNKWTDWSIWNTKIDATIKFQYKNGSGNVTEQQLAWEGNYTGKGSLKLTYVVENSEVHTMLNVQDGKFILPGVIKMQVVNNNTTKITWENTVNFGNNPLKRYLGSSVNSVIHRDIDACLNGLKNTLEK